VQVLVPGHERLRRQDLGLARLLPVEDPVLEGDRDELDVVGPDVLLVGDDVDLAVAVRREEVDCGLLVQENDPKYIFLSDEQAVGRILAKAACLPSRL
jgi:hypothetical protein